MSRRLAVVGAGISGLAAAYFARERAQVTLLEASDRIGGVIVTRRQEGWVAEGGPDSLLTTKSQAIELARELGLEPEIVATRGAGGALVVRGDRLLPIPDGFRLMAPGKLLPFALSPAMSLTGKLRMLLDLVLPRGTSEDPSLSEFVVRRLGREAYERLAQPLAGGIYAADPERLSMAAAMPEFLEHERVHGSLIRGLLKGATRRRGDSGARYSLFFNFRQGTEALVERLEEAVRPGLRRETPVLGLARHGSGWLLNLDHETLEVDAVILAVPAPAASVLLRGVNSELADLVGSVPCSNCATVNLGFASAPPNLRGFGFVVPQVEESYLLATTYSHLKWPGPAPARNAR
ncbi:MAG: protoporphyrinogen oxidase, partial [Candidatus Eremiobacterota bacterium]